MLTSHKQNNHKLPNFNPQMFVYLDATTMMLITYISSKNWKTSTHQPCTMKDE
jgi:hypothetical protein